MRGLQGCSESASSRFPCHGGIPVDGGKETIKVTLCYSFHTICATGALYELQIVAMFCVQDNFVNTIIIMHLGYVALKKFSWDESAIVDVL
jgi:hypothetical protein